MPLYEGLGLINEKHTTVVLDLGHAYSKVGFAGETGPRAIIPSVIQEQNSKINKNVFEYKNENELRRNLVQFIHKIYFKHLLVNPKDRRVVIVENILGPSLHRDILAKVLFRHYEVLSILYVPSHLMSLMTLGCSTGLVLDLGYKEATLIPVYEGVPLLKAWQSLPLGAKAIHESLNNLLLDRAVCLGVGGKEQRLNQVYDQLPQQALEDIKVRACFVTKIDRKERLQANKEDRSVEPPSPPPNVDYPLGGNRRITIPGTVREMAAEVLFESDRDCLCLPSMILDSILQCPVDIRKDLAENLVVIGGSATLMGMKHRIMSEVRTLSETDYYQNKIGKISFKIHTPPAKDNYVAWLGAAIFGSTESVGVRSLMRDVYLKTNSLPDWCNLAYNIKEELNVKAA